jgi:hypothetical protein
VSRICGGRLSSVFTTNFFFLLTAAESSRSSVIFLDRSSKRA